MQLEITCPFCATAYVRGKKHINSTIKKRGSWKCKKCTLLERNKRNAKPVGSVRTHDQRGYLEEKTPDGWRRQHILVMERHIGRSLKKGEVVHHINEVKTDNRIENLQLMSNGEHTTLHHTGMKRTENQVKNIKSGVRRVARLNVEKAEEIRNIYWSGNRTQSSIAIEFGVSTMTINRVVNQKTWN